jgi:hypothetical protein
MLTSGNGRAIAGAMAMALALCKAACHGKVVDDIYEGFGRLAFVWLPKRRMAMGDAQPSRPGYATIR